MRLSRHPDHTVGGDGPPDIIARREQMADPCGERSRRRRGRGLLGRSELVGKGLHPDAPVDGELDHAVELEPLLPLHLDDRTDGTPAQHPPVWCPTESCCSQRIVEPHRQEPIEPRGDSEARLGRPSIRAGSGVGLLEQPCELGEILESQLVSLGGRGPGPGCQVSAGRPHAVF